ncbi:hypothetical protein N7466_006120 [Penicillium verhagenii]|uniref:uncharacterized protein n=1 Tax=Penicillium verhagenii TaxID=1562060 RepID=UPI002545BA47|nr:uncharacterized protein N7466_006120 [Penicillium verhagenii]KAJ5930627.1 hypothetical protein N7466_006120 [Penicillium verhagenii]
MDFVPQPTHSKPNTVNVPLLDGMLYEVIQPGDIEKSVAEAGREAHTFSSPTKIAFHIQHRFFFGVLAKYLNADLDIEKFSKNIKGHVGRFVCLRMVADSLFDENERHRLYFDEDSDEGKTFPNLLGETRSEVLRLESLPGGNFSPVPEVALSALILCDALIALIMDEQEKIRFPRNTGRELIYNNPVQSPYRHVKWPYPASSENMNNKSDIRAGVQGSLLLIIDRFIKNGWCPSIIRVTARSAGYLTLYYMCQIKRSRSPQLDHTNCKGMICTAAKLFAIPYEPPQAVTQSPNPTKVAPLQDRVDFEPKHALKGCSCSKMMIPVQDVVNILKDDKIPLLKFEKNHQGGCSRLRIVPAKVDSRYVAVSHVWSDGLGNSQDNGIWQCQLDSIVESLCQLPNHRGETMSHLALNRRETLLPGSIPGVYSRNTPYDLFWLDILCIPNVSVLRGHVSDPQELRTSAICQISAVFAGAMQVMILDKEIQNLRLDTYRMPEILALFQGSNWATRAWTYKEGQGSLCYVKVKNGFFNPRDILLESRDWSHFTRRNGRTLEQITSASVIDPYSETSFSSMIERWLSHDLQRLIHQTWFFPLDWDDAPKYSAFSSIQKTTSRLSNTKDSHPRSLFASSKPFISVWNELLRRSCTRHDDLMYIFAMSLQMSPDDVLKIDSDERFKAIIWGFSDVPLSLLFTPCKRLLLADDDTIKRHIFKGDPIPLKDCEGGPDKWLQRAAEDFAFGPTYPLKQQYLGKFTSREKDQITFQFPQKPNNPLLILIPPVKENTPWLRLVHKGQTWIIHFHSVSPAAMSGNAILIIDTRTLAWENDGSRWGETHFDGKWVAGCCLELKSVYNEEPNYWRRFHRDQRSGELHATHFSSISVLQPGKANDEKIRQFSSRYLVPSMSTVDINSHGDLDWPISITLHCSRLPSPDMR